jgi:hypothetical protein
MNPIESSERVALASDALRASGTLRLRVYGESMLPVIYPGDEVEIASCRPSDLERHDVALAVRGERFFLHRFLVAQDNGQFRLRGDSVPCADLAFPDRALLGRVVCVFRNGNPAPRALTRRVWHRPLGLLCAYSPRVRSLVLRLHARKTQSAQLDSGAVAENVASA